MRLEGGLSALSAENATDSLFLGCLDSNRRKEMHFGAIRSFRLWRSLMPLSRFVS
jgi:hypothetical protein